MSDAAPTLRSITEDLVVQEAKIREGGGPRGRQRQHSLGRLVARERINLLVDDPETFLEIGLWAAYEMYPDAGNIAAAGVVAGVGLIHGRRHRESGGLLSTDLQETPPRPAYRL